MTVDLNKQPNPPFPVEIIDTQPVKVTNQFSGESVMLEPVAVAVRFIVDPCSTDCPGVQLTNVIEPDWDAVATAAPPSSSPPNLTLLERVAVDRVVSAMI